jgi:hypothetical protein
LLLLLEIVGLELRVGGMERFGLEFGLGFWVLGLRD